jgi:hypothetical protein
MISERKTNLSGRNRKQRDPDRDPHQSLFEQEENEYGKRNDGTFERKKKKAKRYSECKIWGNKYKKGALGVKIQGTHGGGEYSWGRRNPFRAKILSSGVIPVPYCKQKIKNS